MYLAMKKQMRAIMALAVAPSIVLASPMMAINSWNTAIAIAPKSSILRLPTFSAAH